MPHNQLIKEPCRAREEPNQRSGEYSYKGLDVEEENLVEPREGRK